MFKLVDQSASRAGNVLHPQTALISTIKTLPDYLNASVLREKYLVERLSVKQIADQFASSKAAVLKGLKREGIPLRARYQSHGRPGNPPYGKRMGKGCLVDYPAEQKVIRAIKKMALDEGLTVRAIARRLTEMGIETRSGHVPWHHELVRSILKRNCECWPMPDSARKESSK